MSTENYDATIPLPRSIDASGPICKLQRWWTVVAILIAAAIFAEAVFAGAMLSGYGWARTAHLANAGLLIAATVAAGVVALTTLRRVPRGPKLGLALMSLAVVIFLQTAVGKLSANGANLMWAHIPLGVALVGFAMQAVNGARRLGGE